LLHTRSTLEGPLAPWTRQPTSLVLEPKFGETIAAPPASGYRATRKPTPVGLAWPVTTRNFVAVACSIATLRNCVRLPGVPVNFPVGTRPVVVSSAPVEF